MKFWCVLFLIVVGCSPAPESMRTVGRSIPSPDGVLEAVIVTKDPGALGSVSTPIFVRPAKSRVLIERDRVFVAMYRPKLGNEHIQINDSRELLPWIIPKPRSAPVDSTCGLSPTFATLPAKETPDNP